MAIMYTRVFGLLLLGKSCHVERSMAKTQDPYAVAVLDGVNVISHVPNKISSICSIFLQLGGNIICQVTSTRRYSADLPQGGLEIPCILIFEGVAKDIAKLDKLVKYALSASTTETTTSTTAVTESQPPSKKRRVKDAVDDVIDVTGASEIADGRQLTDLCINFAQQLLKKQFPNLGGLCTVNTLPV